MKPYKMVCSENLAHGYWPLTHHRFALDFAHRDLFPQTKLMRMLAGRCLICGAPNLRLKLVPA